MPRPLRADEAGAIYHALNRGNGRHTIFHKTKDYEAFEKVIADVGSKGSGADVGSKGSGAELVD